MPSPDPNGDRKPGDPFIYKRMGKKLDPVEIEPKQLLAMGVKNLTHEEAAAMLGVHKSTFDAFLAENEEHRDAFHRGKQARKIRLREILDMHARNDPATAWRLAKNELGLVDDPTKAKLDEAQTRILRKMDRDEALGRIKELQGKLGITIDGESRREEPARQARPGRQSAQTLPALPAPGPAKPKAGRLVLNEAAFEEDVPAKPSRYAKRATELGYEDEADVPAAEPADGHRDDPVDAAQDRQGRAAKGATHGKVKGERAEASEGGGREAEGAGSADRAETIRVLQARLAELEASAVRKHPRKDGQPHTDRTKQPAVAPKANTGQVRSYAPALTRRQP
jgi:hypothetical protein